MPDDEFNRFVENLARWDIRREVAEGLAELRKTGRTGQRLGLKRERKKGGAGLAVLRRRSIGRNRETGKGFAGIQQAL
jgi:hypothetical protein